ncbi:hypothetical protein B0F90DRAFT_1696177 [Multifurca ochricompacta]|uniref:F-box domain-containing protein n=1 Tax=Multifurca ochricompacta TaxID=376703 RepID=A0AAD4QRA1_9AGAM|nr:hypothetical protein B0F90DRAFT_1696177 [Multifurca ochricompacta]
MTGPPPLDLSCSLLNLSTELLIRIFVYLPAIDLFSVQHTCHKFYGIVTSSIYLQYILRTQINGVDGILPPGFPLSERLELLRHHEKSWNNLQLNVFADFTYTLQDGYLIFKEAISVAQYRYVDLFTATPNKELDWVHISVDDFHPAFRLVFAVDHNLVVALRTVRSAHLSLHNGASHPLSSLPTVLLPLDGAYGSGHVEAEVLGDYILIKVTHQRSGCSLYLVSWKTGGVTNLLDLPNRWPLQGEAPKLVVIDNNFIALANCTRNMNSLEVYKLEYAASAPSLNVVCLLELPPLGPDTSVVVSMVTKEWVPTSRHYPQPQRIRGRHVPFHSLEVGTIKLVFDYVRRYKSIIQTPRFTMIVSVTAILSAIRSSNVHNVPWADWGPAATRIHPTISRETALTPATADTPSSSSSRWITPVVSSAKVKGRHWMAGEVETYLPYRDIVASDLHVRHCPWTVGDREWIVVISALERISHVTVYHVG